ncbi:hypothetical protein [Duncaniella freteri]|nr:hypothetical protein [Duncaniella freteri]
MGELSQIFYLVKILQRRNQIEASGCRKKPGGRARFRRDGSDKSYDY